MNFGNVARVLTVAAACFAAVGSATSNSNNGPAAQQQSQMNSPPPPQQMEPARALGLWRSTFGAVKIEADNSHGGLQAGAVQGVWMYQRQGQDVIGYFFGNLQGNVLKFRWQEPNNPPLTGEGYIVFEATGRQYSGRWWSDKKDRVGDWNGWRQSNDATNQQPYAGANNAQYGGSQYGGQPQQPPQQAPYPQQQYPQQQQPYPQQQYPQQQPYPQQQQPQQQPYPQQQPQYPQQQPYPPPSQQQPYYPQGQRS